MDNDKYSNFEMIVLQINRQNLNVRVQLNFERHYNMHVILKFCIGTKHVLFFFFLRLFDYFCDCAIATSLLP